MSLEQRDGIDRVFDDRDKMAAEIDRLGNLLFEMGAMKYPPCFKCGYNGPGYFQPETHGCARRHHSLYSDFKS